MDTSSLAGKTPDLFMPVYAAMFEGAWELRTADLVICPGYWSPPRLVQGMTGLIRDGRRGCR